MAEVGLTLENTLLLLASDGVTDVLSDQEMVDIAMEAVEQVWVVCVCLCNVHVC